MKIEGKLPKNAPYIVCDSPKHPGRTPKLAICVSAVGHPVEQRDDGWFLDDVSDEKTVTAWGKLDGRWIDAELVRPYPATADYRVHGYEFKCPICRVTQRVAVARAEQVCREEYANWRGGKLHIPLTRLLPTAKL